MHILAFKTLRAQGSSTPFVRHFDVVSSHIENKTPWAQSGSRNDRKHFDWFIPCAKKREKWLQHNFW